MEAVLINCFLKETTHLSVEDKRHAGAFWKEAELFLALVRNFLETSLSPGFLHSF